MLFGLAVISGAMAQLNGLIPLAKKSAGNQNVTVAPTGLSASTPSKEYVYAGGKLVATEEPIAFNDVPTSHPFYADIMKIADLGVTLGCGGGNYCPDDDVTREQMAAFIIRALGVFNPPAPASQRFTDVPPHQWLLCLYRRDGSPADYFRVHSNHLLSERPCKTRADGGIYNAR
jgi:hypothetical protein